MLHTWSKAMGDNATCERCGSIYSVEIRLFPLKDSDSFKCVVCGHLMLKWNCTRTPSFTLKTTGNKPSD